MRCTEKQILNVKNFIPATVMFISKAAIVSSPAREPITWSLEERLHIWLTPQSNTLQLDRILGNGIRQAMQS